VRPDGVVATHQGGSGSSGPTIGAPPNAQGAQSIADIDGSAARPGRPDDRAEHTQRYLLVRGHTRLPDSAAERRYRPQRLNVRGFDARNRRAVRRRKVDSLGNVHAEIDVYTADFEVRMDYYPLGGFTPKDAIAWFDAQLARLPRS